MNNTETCPKCGAKIPPDAPQGICPKCLMAPIIDTDGNGSPSASPFRDFVPPTVEDLAKHFPDLEILEFIGRGGMGAVYKARQKSLDRFVALKILPPEAAREPAFAERFSREARAMAKLHHPGLVTVFDSGQAGSYYYLVMELVDGKSLREMIRSRQLQPQGAITMIPQICEALQYAHDEGFIHRDIKPENILVDRKGRVKVADFGIAKLVNRSAENLTLTGSQEVMGTLRYMAPEQHDRPGQVDHRADIYSLGLVFYEMLTGTVPMGLFTPPSQKVAIDARIDKVVLRALAQEPEQRYQTINELNEAIRLVGGFSQHNRDTQSVPTPIKAAVSNLGRRWLFVTVALVILSVLFFIGFTRFGETQNGTNDSHFAKFQRELDLIRSTQQSPGRSNQIEHLLKKLIPVVKANENVAEAWKILGEVALEAGANWHGQVAATRIIEITGNPPADPVLNNIVRNIRQRGWPLPEVVSNVEEFKPYVAGTPYLYPVRRNGKMGFIDREGNIAVEPIFEDVHWFSEGLAAVRQSAKWGFINAKGEFEIPPVYDLADSTSPFIGFHEGLAAVSVSNKVGFINRANEMVIPPQFDLRRFDLPVRAIEDYYFHEGLAAVCKRFSWGFIDRTGKFVVPPRYSACQPFSEGLAAVCRDRIWGFVDKNGTEVIRPNYRGAGSFRDGMALASSVSANILIGIDRSGTEVYKDIPCQTKDSIEIPLWASVMPVCWGGLFGFLKMDGMGRREWLTEPVYDYASSFAEGLACVKQGGKMKYVNKNGQVVLDDNYERAGVFKNGLASVVVGGKSFVIDYCGRKLMQGSIVWGGRLTHPGGLISVESGYLDWDGEEVWKDSF